MDATLNSDSPHASASRALEGLLAGYSAGTLEPAAHALVASHLLLRSDNRRFVAALEALASGSLIDAPVEPLGDRDALLAAILEGEAQPRPARPASVLPDPLLQFVGSDLSEIKWRTKLPGVKEFRVSDSGRGEASLLLVKAGRRMPSHTHESSEITLVLDGGFSDTTGHYVRGDIAIAGADLDHRPIADAGCDCLCFAVTDAPLHLTGPVGRIFDRLFGQR